MTNKGFCLRKVLVNLALYLLFYHLYIIKKYIQVCFVWWCLTPIQFVEDTPESYDDVITPEHNSDIKGDVTCFIIIIILKAF